MRVSLGSVEISDRERRALRRWFDKSGLATREEMRRFLITSALEHLDSITPDVEQSKKEVGQ